MFKRKKKTGCETPEYTPPSMPPVEPAKDNFNSRCFSRNMIGTKESFDAFSKLHNDLIKIEGAEVYLGDKSGIVAVVTTQEWKDYFMGRRNAPIVESELTIDEILKNSKAESLPIAYKQLAINSGIGFAVDLYTHDTLVADGYSEAFVDYVIKNDLGDIAHSFGSQKDLSMDVKVLGILYNKMGGSK